MLMGMSRIRARTANTAARSSIVWARLRPKLVALLIASAALIVASGVTVADASHVSSAGADFPKPETSRVKWTPVKAVGAAAGVAGLGTASWSASNRHLKSNPGHERAVVNMASKLVASHWSNLKSHMTKANAMTAAKKGVSLLGFDMIDLLFMGAAGVFAVKEFLQGR